MDGDSCRFFVVRKKRACRMTVRPGALYCGEHQPRDNTESDHVSNDVRIVCPLDPKHTCFKRKLTQHLKVCNARQKELPLYIEKNCNVSEDAQKDIFKDLEKKRPLSDVPNDTLLDVIAIVKKVYEDRVAGNIDTFYPIKHHSALESELNNNQRKDSSKRHLLQTSSLLNIVESENLKSPSTCFIELGAGKGQVSYYLSTILKEIPECSVLLVDKASHRHKCDNKLDKLNHSVIRIRADISDLVLYQIPIIKSVNHVVGISKHLCGAATDFALRCLTKPDINDKCKGIIMATCCHHRCSWNSYVGKLFLQKYNISKSHFDVMCGLVSWATCGTGLSRERRAQKLNEKEILSAKQVKKLKYEVNTPTVISESDIEKLENFDCVEENDKHMNTEDCVNVGDKCDVKHAISNNTFVKNNIGLTLEERSDIGFKSKAILDWGRMEYLKENNFTVKSYFYVDKQISPENVCIVASKNNI